MLRTIACVLSLLVAGVAAADPLTCNLKGYTAQNGLTATVAGDGLVIAWTGDAGSEVRMTLAIDRATPVVRELAVRKAGGQWSTVGRGLVPDYRVVSGTRRVSNQQLDPLTAKGTVITPEVMNRERWYAFWDAPLNVPGVEEGRRPTNPGLPRSPDEVKRATASFNTTSCTVTSEGARVAVDFPGLSMGMFAGSLRFTVYRGTNLVRLDAVASTTQDGVAYKYDGGLKGLSTALTPRITWRDIGGEPQQYRFGGQANDAAVPVRAKNRVLVAEGPGGSIATFPPPITFFFTREVDTNLGYVWYRKDGDTSFAMGVRQAEREDEEEYRANFALYNAPPGSMQRMATYFYVSPAGAEATRASVMAFTNNDVFKPVPGYKTMVNHFHIKFIDRLRAAGGLDGQTPDLLAMKALGLNIVGLSDFHADKLRARDNVRGRFEDQRDYAIASAKASDRDFLVAPWEEPNSYFGGHYNVMFPHNVYFSRAKDPGQAASETLDGFGKVYHPGDAAEFTAMLEAEGGYWFHAHPRTKGTTGYPDAVVDAPFVKSDRYLGMAFKPGMGVDLSLQRLCEYRCFETQDMLNNRYAGTGLKPKLLIADTDTYHKGPEDDIYPNIPVNYLKLDRVPGPGDDWSPILNAVRSGDYFVTTGQILIRNYAVSATGPARTITADLEWTFPLEFMEVVWGDGTKVDRKVIPMTDVAPFGSRHISLPFDAAGKKWVRFAVWDSAGNGAFVNPVWIDAAKAPPSQAQ